MRKVPLESFLDGGPLNHQIEEILGEFGGINVKEYRKNKRIQELKEELKILEGSEW